jgi:hypothetical protein
VVKKVILVPTERDSSFRKIIQGGFLFTGSRRISGSDKVHEAERNFLPKYVPRD